MYDVMSFPDNVEDFMEEYKMVDTNYVYSNGIEYVPIFRMQQWFEHVGEIESWVPEPCRNCSNNPRNGGSGVCHCTLGRTGFTC